MGARQSRRSVDITTTPKKDGLPAEGGVVGDAAAPGDGKLERIEEADAKPTSNGVAPHTDVSEDKEKDKDEATEKDKEKQHDEVKSEDGKADSGAESPAEGAEVTTPTDAATPVSPNAATSPDAKEPKKKEKMKKRWSFRSISFTKKDKSKPAREDAPKNGDVTKEEPLAEGCEEAENAAASSPTEEKSAVSSPTEAEGASVPSSEAKEEKVVGGASPAEEKKEETGAAVPAEEKNDEPAAAAVDADAEKKATATAAATAAATAVEVSPREVTADPREVSVPQVVQQVAAPSIIERKTSEDIPPPLPSSPPPTPIDPSPLQQAQQAAANATALAEALKLPAEAAAQNCDKSFPTTIATTTTTTIAATTTFITSCENPRNSHESPDHLTPKPIDEQQPSPTDAFEPAKESLPVVDREPRRTREPETPAEHDVIPEKLAVIPEKYVQESEKSENEETERREEKREDEKLENVQVVEEIKIEEVTAEESVVGETESKEELIVVESETETVEKEEVVEEVFVKESNRVVTESPEMTIETEEGPVPVSDVNLVEAKPAVVIPEDEVLEDQPADNEIDDSRAENTESVEVIVDPEEEKLENEATSRTEEIVVSDVEVEEPEEASAAEELPAEMADRSIIDTVETSNEPITETIVITEKMSDEVKEIIEIAEMNDNTVLPPPPPVVEKDFPEDLEEATTKQEEPVLSCPLVESKRPITPEEPAETISQLSPSNEENLIEPEVLASREEESSVCSDDLPPAPVETECADSFEYPLPPEELSCPNVPSSASNEVESEIPEMTDDGLGESHPTETLLASTTNSTPSCPRSNVSIASNLTTTTTATTESSQLRLHEDDSNREFKMESVSLSLNSYGDSDVDSKERLVESPAVTGDQEETLSCRLSNGVASPVAIQENHQSIPEAEAPVENSVAAHETSMTESIDEAPKVAPPAVPMEAPAAPPSAPAITEDVASVTKAIEEIEISDKAVAAAVNEAIECNKNEIVAEAPYQNNVNE